ncbi:MAG: xylulokinase, partial [Treponema sp.]|nr:xylulokinase [Treponema sp.]
RAPIGCEGITILPFFNGERTPNLPNGRASINGITAANYSRENLARAALESAIFGMRMGLDSFIALGFKPKAITLTGGGAKSPLWQRIAANVMNLPVSVPSSSNDADSEAAAMGAAIQALLCLQQAEGKKTSIEALAELHIKQGDIIKPDKKSVSLYNEAYSVYTRYLGALSPLYI